MTLDKAIEVYEFWANAHERDAEYHRPLGYAHESIANVAEMDAKEERQIAKWLKELKERRAEQTEPQYILREPTDEERQAIIECAKDEPYEYEIKALHKDYVEPYVKISKTEPQTEECPFDDAVPCEWVCTEYGNCKYKQKTEPQTCEECDHWNDTEDGCADRHGCKDEPQSLEQFRVGLEYHTDTTHFGKTKGESIATNKVEDEPQAERSSE